MTDFENLSGIGDELQLQLRAAQIRETRAGKVDSKTLKDEWEMIGFNSDYTTSLGTTIVESEKGQLEIHKTGNFRAIFRAADLIPFGKIPDKHDPIADAVNEPTFAPIYVDILRHFKVQYPATFSRMREVIKNIEEQKKFSEDDIRKATKEELDDWDLATSYAYGAAADITHSIYPDFNLENLYIAPRT